MVGERFVLVGGGTRLRRVRASASRQRLARSPVVRGGGGPGVVVLRSRRALPRCGRTPRRQGRYPRMGRPGGRGPDGGRRGGRDPALARRESTQAAAAGRR